MQYFSIRSEPSKQTTSFTLLSLQLVHNESQDTKMIKQLRLVSVMFVSFSKWN